MTALSIAVAVYLLVVAGLVLAGRRTAAKEVVLLLPNLILLF